MNRTTTRSAVGIAAAASLTAGAWLALAQPGGAGPAVASATLVDINGRPVGEATFRRGPDGSRQGRVQVVIDNAVTGNPTEFHGFHIHVGSPQGCVTFPAGQEPAPAARFTEVGPHWNPTGASHGAHAGDLPSLLRNPDGTATAELRVDKAHVDQLVGRALIVHHLADDFGKHPTQGTSATTGNAGPRYACGVIVASARG